jgi:hypothetical protein
LHVAVIAAAAVFAVVMVVAAGWVLTRPKPSARLPVGSYAPGTETSQGASPATNTGGVVPSPGSGAASTSTSTSSNDTGTTGPGSGTSDVGRRFAFHIGNSLYVAKEDGKTISPMHIVGTNYALSPDGRTVAAIEKGKLVVAKVGEHLLATSPETPGLSAEAVAPAWAPDSSGFYFVRTNKDGMPRIWRYDRATGAAVEVGAGSEVVVSPDGKTIAVMPTEEDVTPVIGIQTLGSGAPRVTIKVPSGEPVAIALSRDRVFVSSVSATGDSTLWSFAYDGTDRHKLVTAAAVGGSSATYGEMMPSPDGSKLLFAADGDDGYSRLYIVPSAGGTLTAISGRRDGYALGWTRDATGILFIEGNSFQGQTTALLKSDLTGHRRTTLVKGATL